MDAGTIFVLCMAAGFVAFIVYLAIVSRRTRRERTEGTVPSQKREL
jgi:hypothetical protein